MKALGDALGGSAAISGKCMLTQEDADRPHSGADEDFAAAYKIYQAKAMVTRRGPAQARGWFHKLVADFRGHAHDKAAFAYRTR
jgi:hypothetical protein